MSGVRPYLSYNGSPIEQLGSLTCLTGFGGFSPPYVQDDGTIAYDLVLSREQLTDGLTDNNLGNLNNTILVMLGDIWGTTARASGPLTRQYGGEVFQSGVVPLGGSSVA